MKNYSFHKTHFSVTGEELFVVFGTFFVFQIAALPLLAYLFFQSADQTKFDLMAIGVSLLVTICLLGWIGSLQRQALFGKDSYFKSFFLGCAFWLVSYPVVLVVATLSSWLLSYFVPGVKEENQVAIRHLLWSLNHSPFAWALIVGIIGFVPFVEEFLFRGFLQTYLKGKLGIKWAIVLTSGCFAGFHFSCSQGWGNMSLLLALFTLSCFLGALFEKRSSLWAPYGLHATFNAVSVLMIGLTK